jgi:hypothetical protein
MKTFNATFSINGEIAFVIPFIDKKNLSYEVYLKNADIVDVNHFIFEPKAGDYWDKETGLLIPNYVKRNKKIELKTEEQKQNLYYFAYVDKEGNVLLRQSWFDNGSEGQDYVISVFKNNPDITLEEVEDDFYDDEELEKSVTRSKIKLK